LIISTILLSLNSFGREGFNINESNIISAKKAKLETKRGKRLKEEANKDQLFYSISEAANSGKCDIFIELQELPNDYEQLLTKLEYKLEYYEFIKKERISWCD